MITLIIVTDKQNAAIFAVIASLLHEFGHIFAMKLLDYNLKRIKIGFVNSDIILSVHKNSDMIKILLSGSFVNFCIALISKLLFFYTKKDLFEIIFLQNFFIGMLNLFPIEMLDGGIILSLILNDKIGNFEKSKKISNIISVVFLIPIAIVGFLVLLSSKYNFSLILLSCYLFSYILFKEDIF